MPNRPACSRRTLLTLSTAAALTACLPGSATAAGAGADTDEFGLLRRRWAGIALAHGFRSTMSPAADSLWPGIRYNPPSGITQSYNRLWTMAQASESVGVRPSRYEGWERPPLRAYSRAAWGS